MVTTRRPERTSSVRSGRLTGSPANSAAPDRVVREVAEHLDAGHEVLDAGRHLQHVALGLGRRHDHHADPRAASARADQDGIEGAQPLAGVDHAGDAQPQHAHHQVGGLRERQVHRLRVQPPGVDDHVGVGQRVQRAGQRPPQRSDRVHLLGAGQPGDHLDPAEDGLGVLAHHVRGQLAPGQRQQRQQTERAVERGAVGARQPQGDVAAVGVGVDQHRRPRPQRGGEQRGGGDAGGALGAEEGDQTHRSPPGQSSTVSRSGSVPAASRATASCPAEAAATTSPDSPTGTSTEIDSSWAFSGAGATS